jgi:hypothetical protein
MKPSIALTLMLALALAAVPALAGEEPGTPTAVGDTFQALRTLPAGEQAQLIALDEAQLAAIEGGQVCLICANVAVPLNLLSPGATAQTGDQSIQ